MFRYQSKRHRLLMDESEQALADAAHSRRPRVSRIARDVLADSRVYRVWESRHADLVAPVAQQSRRTTQLFELRDLEVKLLHRRALIRSIRRQGIVGEGRDRLFKAFYGPRDSQDAILAEHRQYTLAVSSRVSADHLVNLMQDSVSTALLKEYQALYSDYFEQYCLMVSCGDPLVFDALLPEMTFKRKRVLAMIKRIHTEKPLSGPANIDQQAMLARSGRYPIRDYLIR